jgi:hypothetical protein
VNPGTGKRPAASRADVRHVPRDSGAAKSARARRGFLSWRRNNRRITVEQRSLLLWMTELIGTIARRLLVVVKALAAIGALAGVVYLGRLGVQHVVASPRFALRQLRVDPTEHLTRDQVVGLTGVSTGDRLLTLDTDAVAARLAAHPWIASARVRRELPSTLVINVVERRAAAVVLMGGPYLVDEAGHAFKPATLVSRATSTRACATSANRPFARRWRCTPPISTPTAWPPRAPPTRGSDARPCPRFTSIRATASRCSSMTAAPRFAWGGLTWPRSCRAWTRSWRRWVRRA